MRRPRSPVLVVFLMLILNLAVLLPRSALAWEQLYIAGSYADLETAQELRIEGRFVEDARSIPDGAAILIVGSPQAQGGVDERAEQGLRDRGGRVLRIAGSDDSETRALLEEFRNLQQSASGTADPFADLPGLLSGLHSPALSRLLRTAPGTADPTRVNTDPRTRSRTFLPPIPGAD